MAHFCKEKNVYNSAVLNSFKDFSRTEINNTIKKNSLNT